MLEVEHCLCCGSRRLEDYPALVAPFIADYVLKAPPSRVRLFRCPDCNFLFFSSRFDDREIQRLYTNYRGPDYLRARQKREFWYSKKINDSIGWDPAEIASRNAVAMEFIRARIDPASIERVLDYGGDRGQFIPPELGKERVVFEISGLDPVDGVTMVTSKEALAGRGFDLIMLANVLEHCSDPNTMLDEIKALARPEGSIFLIAVPLERVSLAWVPRRGLLGRAYRKFLGLVAVSPAWVGLFDFYSTVCRLKLRCVPPLGFLKLHEHINFFDEGSLETLLRKRGFTVLDCKAIPSDKLVGFSASILCLARASKET